MDFLLLFSALIFGTAFFSGDEAKASTEPDPEPDPSPDPEPEPDTGLVSSGTVANGSGSDETFTGDPDGDGQIDDATVNAGGGNDILDFYIDEENGFTGEDPFPADVSGGSFNGEDGDDVISIFSTGGSTVSGGAGDDTITGVMMGGEVYGNEGDDLIEVSDYSAPNLFVDGGNGNDTIDAGGYEGSTVLGGAGDDEIIIRLGTFDHEADLISGGDGNDRIVFDGAPISFGAPASAEGGAGADVFDVRTSEGFEPVPAGLANDDVDTREIVEFPDFEPGTDLLQVEAYTQGDTHALTSARMDEIDGTTQVVLRYESDTLAEIEVVITLGTTGVTWDDVDFVGAEVPVLVA